MMTSLNMKTWTKGKKSWDSISDGVDDGNIDDRSYDEYDKDSEEYDEQRPRVIFHEES